jgi:hypothetical protein
MVEIRLKNLPAMIFPNLATIGIDLAVVREFGVKVQPGRD